MDKEDRDNVSKEEDDMTLLAPSINPKAMTSNKKAINFQTL